MSSKRNLKRQVRELAWMVDMYADLVDELENDLVDRNEGLDEAEKEIKHRTAQVDELLKVGEMLQSTANELLQERNEALREMVRVMLDEPPHEDIADKMVNDDAYNILKEERDEYKLKLEAAERTLSESAKAQERLNYLNEFNRKRANKYEAQAEYWKLFADLCDTEKMTAYEITFKTAHLAALKLQAGI